MRTIAISEDDLRNLLIDKNRLETQVTELQTRNTELLTEVRALKEAKKAIEEEEPFPSYFGGVVGSITKKTGCKPSPDDDQDFFPDYGERSNGR